jgi:hypothetical protein
VAPTLGPGVGAEIESLIGDGVAEWKELGLGPGVRIEERSGEGERLFPDDDKFEEAFETEFEDVEDIKDDNSNEGILFALVSAKAYTRLATAATKFRHTYCRDSVCSSHLDIKAQALSHPFHRGKAYLLPARL